MVPLAPVPQLVVSRLAASFAAQRGSTGLIPFVTAGYPSLEVSLEILRGFARLGVTAVELGVPFSDPIADGPDIQRASEWAVDGGVGVAEVLGLVRELRRDHQVPVVLMTYANPILRDGVEAMAAAARDAGVDGVLVSDLPPEEAGEVWAGLDNAGLDTIVLVAPTTTPDRMPGILARARGFVYCLARTGVSGSGPGDSGALPQRIAAIRARTQLPVAVGFGIASGAHARTLRGLADAVVVGAAFMRVVAEDPRRGATDRVLALAGELREALRPA